MKLVSWNVNGIRACIEKGFRFLTPYPQIFFAYRKQKCSKARFK